MLRRNPDHSLEFLEIDALLERGGAHERSQQRRDALRQRIFASLGAQDRKEPFLGFRTSERWVSIPAGLAVAAVILLAMRGVGDAADRQGPDSGFVKQLMPETGEPRTGERFVAVRTQWIDAAGAAVGLESGTIVTRDVRDGVVTLRFESGRLTIATGDFGIVVVGDGWSADIAANTVAIFASNGGEPAISVLNGAVMVSTPAGVSKILPAAPRGIVPAPGTEKEVSEPRSQGGQSPGADDGDSAPEQGDSSPPAVSPAELPPTAQDGASGTPPAAPGNGLGNPPANPGNGNGNSPGDPGNENGTSPGNGNPPAEAGNGAPPADPGNGNGNPPADPGNGNPPADPGNGNGNPPTDPGNGTPPANPGNGNGNPPANPGNGTPPANPGNGNPPSDSGNDKPAKPGKEK